MSDTLRQPVTPAEQAEVDFGQDLAASVINSTVVGFGANDAGEIYLAVEKDGKVLEIVIGKDEFGDVAVYELLAQNNNKKDGQ